MEIKSQLAVITGGASGLGAGAVKALAEQGAKIAIFDLNHESGEALAKEVSGHFFEVDITNEEQVKNALSECREKIAPPRILVNAAGISKNYEILDDDKNPHALKDFIRIIDINLIGTYNCLRLFASEVSKSAPLEDGEKGVVINVASMSGLDSPSRETAYAASKSGVIGLTLGAARSLSDHGIRVVTVAPGLFRTPMLEAAPVPIEMLEQATKKAVPFPPRIGEPYEFGQLVVAISNIQYLNGEVIRLDGGSRVSFNR